MRGHNMQHLCILFAYLAIGVGENYNGNGGSHHGATADKTDFDLESFRNRFRIAFPESIGFFNPQNSSLRGMNAEPKDFWTWSCSDLVYYRELPDLVEDMITNPRARLYSWENHTGEFEDYHFRMADFRGGCHDLDNLRYRVRSVETYGKCIRLASTTKCSGWTLAVHPGSGNSHRVLIETPGVVGSVGPCLPYEFQGSSLKSKAEKTVVKDSSDTINYIPDRAQFYSRRKYQNKKTVRVTHGSVTHYLLGPQNRIEFIQAIVSAQHYNATQSEENIDGIDFFKSLEKEVDDVMCYGVPTTLGGPSNEAYNIFSCSPSAMNDWGAITGRIPPPSDYPITIALNFEYQSDANTRPFAIYYWINNEELEILYGRVLN